MTASFTYDVVDYPSVALPQVHPGHIHAVARMFGVAAAPVDRCRYLEIGCGDGLNLIAAAAGLPEATFVGIDLSSAAITRGQAMIAELGLANVSLYAADLTAWTPPAGGFDYVVAHGLYSWVPATVRDALLAVTAPTLRATGVGYVSYNTYPGCYMRRMAWEILRFHTNEIAEPRQKIGQARELIKFLLAGQPRDRAPVPALFTHLLDELLDNHDPSVLYHDDLSPVNDPVYFHEFAAHAKRFGLRFVAEAEMNVMETRAFPPAVAGALDGLAERDPVLKEQYIDFLRLRRFRETLLSNDGRAPRKVPDGAAIAGLAISGKPKPGAGPVDLAKGVAVSFTSEGGASVQTDLPLAKAALVELASRWPRRLSFEELLRRAAGRIGREPDPAEGGQLGGLLTDVWMSGMIALNGHIPSYVETVSERPVASPLARLLLRSGSLAATLLHEPMRFDDPPSRLLVQLLDGTRTREQLAQELLAAFPQDKQPDHDTLMAGLENNLERLARSALLVG
jgi:predicted methyltransferase family protein/methyltransferase family protein/protein-lysine methyltransferase-like protein